MVRRIGVLALTLFLASSVALAGESYVGASVGQSKLQASESGLSFDDGDKSFKVFGGFRFLKFLGVEGSYVNMGSPTDTVSGTDIKVDTTAWDAFAVGAIPLGLVELFAKAGYVRWSTDVKLSGAVSGSSSDSGTDRAYGVGFAFKLVKVLAIRAEYERFDIKDTDKADLASVGVALRF